MQANIPPLNTHNQQIIFEDTNLRRRFYIMMDRVFKILAVAPSYIADSVSKFFSYLRSLIEVRCMKELNTTLSFLEFGVGLANYSARRCNVQYVNLMLVVAREIIYR